MHTTGALEIKQTRVPSGVRLTLVGELDLWTAPALEYRLRGVGGDDGRVVLDLSALDFIDLAGARVLAQALADARDGDWLKLGPELSRPVQRLFELVELDRLVAAG